MDTILVIDASASRVEFETFVVEGEGVLRRQARGQLDGLGHRPHLKAGTAAGDPLANRAYPVRSVPDVPAAFGIVAAWLRNELRIRPLAVGHRVAQGAPDFDRSVLIDNDVLARLERLAAFAPLHQPHNLEPIRAILTTDPTLPQVACFRPASHSSGDDDRSPVCVLPAEERLAIARQTLGLLWRLRLRQPPSAPND